MKKLILLLLISLTGCATGPYFRLRAYSCYTQGFIGNYGTNYGGGLTQIEIDAYSRREALAQLRELSPYAVYYYCDSRPY
jgi:hypothetical protein